MSGLRRKTSSIFLLRTRRLFYTNPTIYFVFFVFFVVQSLDLCASELGPISQKKRELLAPVIHALSPESRKCQKLVIQSASHCIWLPAWLTL